MRACSFRLTGACGRFPQRYNRSRTHAGSEPESEWRMATPCADLVHALSERLEAAIAGTGVEPPDDLGRYASESLVRYDRAAEELLTLVIAGCHEGAEADAPLWVRCIERIANLEDVPALPAELRRLRRYPALLLLYGGGPRGAGRRALRHTARAALRHGGARVDRRQAGGRDAGRLAGDECTARDAARGLRASPHGPLGPPLRCPS